VPWAVIYMVSAPLSARLVERWSQRRVVSTGLTVVATGLALLCRSGSQAHYPLLALALMLTAAGMGMTTAPSTGAIMVSLPLDKAGVGSAVNDTTRELGGALGVAVFGSVVASQYHADLAHRLTGLPGAAGPAHASLGSALQTAAALPRPAAQALSSAARQAYVHALDTTLLVAVGVALLAAALVRWLLRPSPAEVQAEEDTIALQAA
jgi:MFS family permease